MQKAPGILKLYKPAHTVLLEISKYFYVHKLVHSFLGP